MANINLPFDKELSANKPALKVKNNGIGDAVAFWGETTQYGTGGVLGVSSGNDGVGVLGKTTGAESAGVKGVADGVKSVGVFGITTQGQSAAIKGVSTESESVGVLAESTKSYGVWGKSQTTHDILGESFGSNDTAGVAGWNNNWVGVWGYSANKVGILGEGPIAGRFVGNVEVTGDITLLNQDCAEEFNIVEENVDAGTVMVIAENGLLEPSHQEYDKKVAGIISGASGYKPAIVLGSEHSQNQNDKDLNNKNKDRLPIALMGKVYCKVDARDSSIEIGDLLTTSSTKGHAMKAENPVNAFGAIIGKALGSIKEGLGMIPVLVTLQ